MSWALTHPQRTHSGTFGRAAVRRLRAAWMLPMLLVPAVLAALVAAVVHLVSTSLPYFATSPTVDPQFGAQNHCLARALPEARAGFAVSPDGRWAASFSGTQLVLCERGGDGAARVHLRGVRQLAFDFQGMLWVVASERGDRPWGYRVPPGGAPEPVGELDALALVGHARGVAALEASGRLVSLGGPGHVLATAQLAGLPEGDAQLAIDATGEVASVVSGGAVWFFRTADLRLLRAEVPCHAEFLWWLPGGTQALIACGPKDSYALTLEPLTGARELAPKGPRARAALVPELGAYVQGCEGLPCSAPPP
jgi:hypothetical protein